MNEEQKLDELRQTLAEHKQLEDEMWRLHAEMQQMRRLIQKFGNKDAYSL